MLTQAKPSKREKLTLKKIEKDGRDVRRLAVFIHRSDFTGKKEFESSRE